MLVQSDDQFPLLEAAASIAQDEYPDLDVQQVLGDVDQLLARLKRRIPADAAPLQRLRALNQFFFRDLSFGGNVNDYCDPDNSHINVVLRTRRGIQISLAVLWIELAQGLGLHARGVCFPGHFMVKFEDDGNELYVDTFNGGRFLSRPECVQFMVEAGYPYQPEFMEGVGPREILARMLRNLILIYVDRHEPTLEKTLTRFMDLLYKDQKEKPDG